MPKKANRPAARTRARPARRVQRPSQPVARAEEEVTESNGVATATAAPVAATRPAFAGATAVRRGPASRRAPTTAINYAYLRHDLTLLAILAPVMIVVVVIASFVLR